MVVDEFISPEPMSGCWLWTGNLTHGYAALGKKRIHRLMWEREHGPIPQGLYVCHKCDVPLCVNPSHLFLGTQKDNIQDMIQKGRANFIKHGMANAAKTHCPYGHPYDAVNTYRRPNGTRLCRACKRYRRQKIGIQQNLF